MLRQGGIVGPWPRATLVEMAEVHHDLGTVERVEVEAIGPPGQRAFRIRILSDAGAAALWVEKEQVSALGTAIEQVLAQHRQGGASAKPRPPALQPFPDTPAIDIHVSRLALGYEEGAERLSLYATDAEASNQERPTLRATFTRQQARLFSAQAAATVKAGRPLCPLCEAPLEDGGHLCPPSNGHSDDALGWIGPPQI